MIYFGATEMDWGEFFGDEPEGSPDLLTFFQGNDPLVLEQRINAWGRDQFVEEGRRLIGIQIAGGGKGADFTVGLLMQNSGTPTTLNDHHFTPTDTDAGLAVFLYSGESQDELNNRKQDALGRARAFVSGHVELDSQWRGFEMAGATDGLVSMGMFVVCRGDVED